MSCCCPQAPTVVLQTGPPPEPPVFGEVFSPGVDLQAAASGAWVDVPGLEVVLPEAGTYELEGEVSGGFSFVAPGAFVISIRLFDVTAGAAVPDGLRRVLFHNVTAPAGLNEAINGAGSVHKFLTVTGPTTIRLQAQKVIVGGTTTSIALNVANRLAYKKIGGT